MLKFLLMMTASAAMMLASLSAQAEPIQLELETATAENLKRPARTQVVEGQAAGVMRAKVMPDGTVVYACDIEHDHALDAPMDQSARRATRKEQ